MTRLRARPERATGSIRRRSGSRAHAPEAVSAAVGQQIAEFRRELYRGRGPGIGEDERVRHTRNRPDVGGVSPVVSREQNHVNTLRARGEGSSARLEAEWAATQFPEPARGYRQVMATRSGTGRSARALALLAVLVLTWLRSRRRPGSSGNGLTPGAGEG